MNRRTFYEWAMREGLVVGIVGIINFFIVSQLNLYLDTSKYSLTNHISSLISVLLCVYVYIRSKKFRDRECGGEMSYGQAFGYVFWVYFFGGLIETVFVLIYVNFINLDYLENVFNRMMSIFEGANLELPDETIDLLHSIFLPSSYVELHLISNIFAALFAGLFLAILLKKKKKVNDEIKVEEDK